jgi:hypothetical protein
MSIYQLRLLVLSLLLEHHCKIVHAAQCIGMLLSEHLHSQIQRLSLHLLRLLVLSLLPEYYCKVVPAASVSGCSSPSTFTLRSLLT